MRATTTTGSIVCAGALIVLVGANTGCSHDALEVTVAPNTGSDGAVGDGAGIDLGPGGDGSGDAGEADACVPTAEVCDGLDNDCNGLVDDVAAQSLESDPQNCGGCGEACVYRNAFARCDAGQCAMDRCAPGFFDNNEDDSDGCEYQCLPSNGGREECPEDRPDCPCDGVDNDCDGLVDEGFDLDGDINNCGSCGNRCLFSRGQGGCTAGKCELSSCDDEYRSLDGDDTNGCEYKCPVWPPADNEQVAAGPGWPGVSCDGLDNDCDGTADEDFAGGDCGSDEGACSFGTSVCVNGNIECQGGTGPKAELCNDVDDDCDEGVDEDFDKLNDPRNCGGCSPCQLAHAMANCSGGQCGIAVCDDGWVDLDGEASTGCEHRCTETGPEICDGLDNDCDGTADNDLSQPEINPCFDVGECRTSPRVRPACRGTYGWVCVYPPTVELQPCSGDGDCAGLPCESQRCSGFPALQETLCDDLDNNCNGLEDESFTTKDDPCVEEGKQGVCQGRGSYGCATDKRSVVCEITEPGASQPENELCNGLDDDCDGRVDEWTDDGGKLGVRDTMVHIARSYDGTSYDFYIYSYEASRPDADGSTSGTSNARACSKAGALPWANVTYAQASAACQAANLRLCTAEEWYLACSGAPGACSDGCDFPYADGYNGTTCNGGDDPAAEAVATGSRSGCVSADGVFDMSGNLREWTDDPQPPPPATVVGYTTRGGGYDTPELGLRCDSTFVVMPPDFLFPNLGFRCCRTGP